MNILLVCKSFLKLSSYNMRIIFGGKFIWFLILAFILFFSLMFESAWQGNIPTEAKLYSFLFFPAMLLIFYPAVFGIQNDADNRILEILFGIPNYMYKVWLVRLILIYVEIFFIITFYAWIANILLCPTNPFKMAYHIILPVLFMGNLAFYFSTLTRNGNATAILIILSGIAMLVFSSSNSMWNIMLNPYALPSNMHPAIWENILFKNKLFMGIGSIVWILLGLINLQKREKFI